MKSLTYQGFTLIELILVMGIFGIISVVTFAFLSTSSWSATLESTAWDIIGVLRQAQTQAMAGEQDDVWGVHFQSDKYVLFKGGTYSAVDPDNIETVLPNVLSITDISLNGGGSDIIFTRPKGKTTQQGGIEVTEQNSGDTKTISVNPVGKMSIQ